MGSTQEPAREPGRLDVVMLALTQTDRRRLAPAQTVVGPDGRPIGAVIAPRDERIVGRGQGTILLLRPMRTSRVRMA